ncbi:hypothetical protein LOK49_LG14G01359 [Camellia lanceoleosa]|uniref:Uncharacterized protein n=1 Tax=Camellia lanceoleosa TaxID=1840588 RepID=A0ACC0FBZ5_9ERIC|nr:hypothetical protein LOK49_LG14G01359 [Camellia lanceoleosa]
MIWINTYPQPAANIKLRITLTSHLLSTMSFRTPTYWKSMLINRLGGRSGFATSTSPKMKAYAPASEYSGQFEETAKAVRGEFIPVYVAMGMIATSVSLGLTTALHQLMYAPNVRVKKSRRETVPEVVEPELVVDESDKYIKKSLFRKVAHIQEVDVIPEHAHREILTRPLQAETLKEVGVDPKIN